MTLKKAETTMPLSEEITAWGGEPVTGEDQPVRDRVVDTAKHIISGPRRKEYGPPKASFDRIAGLWTALMKDKLVIGDVPLESYTFTAADVAQMLICLKLSRLAETEDHADSWVDIVGYAALGAEVSGVEL